MPKLEECLAYEKKFDYEALIEEALSKFEVMLINSESLNESDELL